jgi:hypothetical protein
MINSLKNNLSKVTGESYIPSKNALAQATPLFSIINAPCRAQRVNVILPVLMA